MKTDNYLTLCLEQAAKSPLHYRHGCIVVRGGKVIGQGYNDYRPGFNGSSLKHGRIVSSSFDGPAIAELKQKQKQKYKLKHEKSKPEAPSAAQHSKNFTPFEGQGGGNHANVPLSMHSEMMAIHSALAASSTMSSTACSCEKPCFKLPGHSKRKSRLRKAVLEAYVRSICQTSQSSGKTQDNARNNNTEEDKDDELSEAPRRVKDSSPAFHEENSGQKHRRQNKKEKNQKEQYEYEYQTRYQYDRSGQQQTPQQVQLQLISSKKIRNDGRASHNVSTISASVVMPQAKANMEHKTQPQQHKQVSMALTLSFFAYSRANTQMFRKKKAPDKAEPPQPQPMLLPIGQTGQAARNVNERKKHPRLNGADLYVARLGWSKLPEKLPTVAATASATVQRLVAAEDDASGYDENSSSDSLTGSTPSLMSLSSSTSTGSLHEELINRMPSQGNGAACCIDNAIDRSAIHASRPCYRCISYMHSVGVKRVFWTNDYGDWEGGKVRDLVDALESSMDNVDGDLGGPTGNGVFVTKHEVLMLRRLMGNSGCS